MRAGPAGAHRQAGLMRTEATQLCVEETQIAGAQAGPGAAKERYTP